MVEQKSAGFIVFKRSSERILYLLLQNSSGKFWDFPKGLIDGNESEEEAAKRELREEANIIDIKIIPGFKAMTDYFFVWKGEKVHKFVVMFLGECSEDCKVKTSWEHSNFDWLPYEKAKDLLSDKKLILLNEADGFLASRLNNWTK